MTRDESNPYIYECEICGKTKALSGMSARDTAAEFKRLGWENVPVENADDSVTYHVYCPDCVANATYEDWRESVDENAGRGQGWL